MKRKFYEQLLNWKNNNVLMPLMVIGARQVGKTYIINEFCKNEFEDYIYINLLDDKSIVSFFEENIDTKDKIEKIQLYLNRQITENTVIFFDEIQESEQLISALKYFYESDFPYKIVCAGSLLGVKLNRFKSSFPVGRVRILKMYPMDFEEFLMALGEDMAIKKIKSCYENNEQMDKSLHEKYLKYYRLYLCVGGMPEAVDNFVNNGLDIFKFDFKILSNIRESYVADMKKYVDNKSESVKIEKVYYSIPEQLAKENKNFQYSILEKNARGRKYRNPIEWLMASKLVLIANNVKRVEIPLKVFADENTFKLYLSDVGLLLNLSEIKYNEVLMDEDFIFKGVITENYVAQELIRQFPSLYYWTSDRDAEVDFLIHTNDGIIPIEVKSGINNKSKSLNVYIEYNKPKYAIRLSTRNFGFENNIKSIPLYATFCIKD